MATIYDLKPRFQALLRPIATELVANGRKANEVTLAGFALSAALGGLIWVTGGHWLVLCLVPVVLFLRMALNAIDGIMAREFAQASRLGQILNEITDVAADAVLYLPFMVVAGLSPVLVALVAAGGIIVEMTGVLGEAMGGARRYDGPLGKSDRAAFFGVLAILAAFDIAEAWLDWALVAALALTVWTIRNRARKILDGDA